MNTKSAKVGMIISMVIFGSIGIFRRYTPLPSGVIACIRGFAGALFLCVVMLTTKKKFTTAKLKSNLLPLILSGIFLGMNWVLLFESYRFTTVAVATVCYYMAPVFVLLFAPIILKERLNLLKILCVLGAFIGIVFVSGLINTNGEAPNIKGILLALGAASLYAAVVFTNKKISGLQPMEITVFQLGVAGICVFFYSLIAEDIALSDFTPQACIFLLIMGIVHTGLAYTLFFGALIKLPATPAALMSYIDPAVAVILSACFLGESISVLQIIGSILVLGATFLVEVIG